VTSLVQKHLVLESGFPKVKGDTVIIAVVYVADQVVRQVEALLMQKGNTLVSFSNI